MGAEWVFRWDLCFSSQATLGARATPTPEGKPRDFLAGLSSL